MGGIRFEIVEGAVTIPPSSLTVPELRVIWDRDTSDKKVTAYQELCYIYHIADAKSEYAELTPDKKKEMIKKDMIRIEDWNPDEAVELAIQKYRELQETISSRFLDAQMGFLHKVTERINEIDIDDIEDDKTMNAILSAAEKANKLLVNIPKLKEAIAKEQTAEERIRGGGEKGMYEE